VSSSLARASGLRWQVGGEEELRRPCLAVRRLALIALAALLGGATGTQLAATDVSAMQANAARTAVPRLQCEQPRRLHLERFEDGSARLLCGYRLLARIGVPW
jgi:hypothetical protein